MVKVSVIMPAYNTENLIRESIESVLKQSYDDFELIIVDDASTDDTYAVAKSYAEKDERVKVFKNEKNMGPAVARNVCLQHAKGEYIAFLDSDDLWYEDKLKKQLAFMEENGYAFSYTYYERYYIDEKDYSKVVKMPKAMTANKILYNTAIGCLTVMVNRKKTGDFVFYDMPRGEDTSCWHFILKRGYTAYCFKETLSVYKVYKSNLIKSKFKCAYKMWNVYRKYYKFSFIQSFLCFSGYCINALKRYL